MNPKAPSQSGKREKKDLLSSKPPALLKIVAGCLDIKSQASFARVKKTYGEHIDYKKTYEFYFPDPYTIQLKTTEEKSDSKTLQDEKNSLVLVENPQAVYKKRLQEAHAQRSNVMYYPTHQTLLYLAKEGNLAEIKKLNLGLTTTDVHCSAYLIFRYSYLFWANAKGHQALCKYVYETVKNEYEGGWVFGNGIFDVKRLSASGHTLLHCAIICHQGPAVLAPLIEAGADSQQRLYSMNPLELAAAFGNKPAFVFLYQHYIDKQDFINPHTLLCKAARYGHLNIVQYLYKERQQPIDNNVLENAIQGNHLPIIKYLLTKGATITNPIIELAIRSIYSNSGYESFGLEVFIYLFDHFDGAVLPDNVFDLYHNKSQKVLECLLERKFKLYKQAKENLQNEIDQLPPGSILQTVMQAFLGEISGIKKKSEAEMILLIEALDKTTVLLSHINKGTYTQDIYKTMLEQYRAFNVEKCGDLPENGLLGYTLIVIATSLLFLSTIFLGLTIMLSAGIFALSGAIMMAIGFYLALKWEDHPRKNNVKLYTDLSASMNKVAEVSARALRDHSVFAPKESNPKPLALEYKAEVPESKRSSLKK